MVNPGRFCVISKQYLIRPRQFVPSSRLPVSPLLTKVQSPIYTEKDVQVPARRTKHQQQFVLDELRSPVWPKTVKQYQK